MKALTPHFRSVAFEAFLFSIAAHAFVMFFFSVSFKLYAIDRKPTFVFIGSILPTKDVIFSSAPVTPPHQIKSNVDIAIMPLVETTHLNRHREDTKPTFAPSRAAKEKITIKPDIVEIQFERKPSDSAPEPLTEIETSLPAYKPLRLYRR